MQINIQQINAGNENLESIKIENQRNERFRGRKRLGPVSGSVQFRKTVLLKMTLTNTFMHVH